MNYHNITEDMLNGDGIRAVLWVAGCSHHCAGCQNSETWNPDGGVVFDEEAEKELFDILQKDYVSGITFSGGDPLFETNLTEVYRLVEKVRAQFPEKDIWLYSGYTLEEVQRNADKGRVENLRYRIVLDVDVFVDGPFIEGQKDVSLEWRGSRNQRVIRVKMAQENNL